MLQPSDFPTESLDRIADIIIQSLPDADLSALIASNQDYSIYRNDPVGFCEDVFGEIYTDDIKKVMESVWKNRITIAMSANSTGKTHAAARIAVAFRKIFPDSKVHTAAAPPEDNLRKILWGEIGKIVSRHPELFVRDDIKSLEISTTSTEFIAGYTIPAVGTHAERVAKFSGKHAPHQLFIFDEGDAVPDACYEGAESCMSGSFERLLIMFNPRQEMGTAYRYIRDGIAHVVELSAFSHPNVITGDDIIPGAVTRERTVDRINRYSRPLTAAEETTTQDSSAIFQVPDFLVGTTAKDPKGRDYPPLPAGRRKIKNPALSYMTLARYPAEGVNQLISTEWIYAARARWDSYIAQFGEIPPEGVKAVMGVDCADQGVDYNVCYFRYGGYVAMPEQWNGVDMIATGDRASEEYRKRKTEIAFVDGTGVGAGVAPHMRRLACNAHKVMVASSPTKSTEMGEFKLMRDQLLWSVREWLRADTGAMLPPVETLLEELMIPTYEIKKGKIIIMDKATMKEHIKRSPDDLDALALTFAGVNYQYQSEMSGAFK
jgi:hypothetical protein